MQSLDTIHDYLRLCGAPHNGVADDAGVNA